MHKEGTQTDESADPKEPERPIEQKEVEARPLTQPKLSIHNVTNDVEWDSSLLSTKGAGLLQSWRWGEFKRQSGWSPLRLIEQADAAPLVSAQILFRKLPQIPVPISIAYVPRGPIYFKGANLVEPGSTAFWQAIHRASRKRGAIFLKVEPNIALGEGVTQQAVDHTMEAEGFIPSGRLQPARTIVLYIGKSEDELLKAMKPKTRYNLRLAERRGVRVHKAATASDLHDFYSLLAVTGERDEFGIHAFPYYEQLWRIFGPEGNNTALVLLADHPDEQERKAGPIAGLLALRFGQEAIYMYGASANRGREHMPNYLLQWEAIKWAQDNSCRIYDFWGIPDAPAEDGGEGEVSPTNARSGLRGVYWFKKGFGGREVDYPGAYDYIYNPLLYKIWMRWRGANLG